MKFEEVIYPTQKKDFFKEFLGKKPLINKGVPGRFSSLLEWSEINRIILEHRLEHPRLRMFKNLNLIPANNYINKTVSRRGSSNPTILIREFNNEILNGATLIIDAIQEIHKPIRDICLEFDHELKGICQANSYIALADQQAFDTHWDGHDVFVLQVIGEKYWKIYHPTRMHPLDTDLDIPNIVDQNSEKKIFWEGVINEGDMLYIPRGWWHSVSPIGKETVHLSIGYNSPTGVDFFKWITKNLHSEELFRAPTPLFDSINEEENYISSLNNIIQQYLSVTSFNQYLEDRISKLQPRTSPALPYSADPQIKALPKNIHIKPTHKNILLNKQDKSFFLLAYNKRYEIDAEYLALTELILSHSDGVSVSELINTRIHSEEITNAYIVHLMRLGLLQLN